MGKVTVHGEFSRLMKFFACWFWDLLPLFSICKLPETGDFLSIDLHKTDDIEGEEGKGVVSQSAPPKNLT
jgi:hypothetical protein